MISIVEIFESQTGTDLTDMRASVYTSSPVATTSAVAMVIAKADLIDRLQRLEASLDQKRSDTAKTLRKMRIYSWSDIYHLNGEINMLEQKLHGITLLNKMVAKSAKCVEVKYASECERYIQQAAAKKAAKDQSKAAESAKLLEKLQRLEACLEAKRVRAKERFISQKHYEKCDLHRRPTPTCIPLALGLWYQVLSGTTGLVSASTCREKSKCGQHEQCLKCAKQAQEAEKNLEKDLAKELAKQAAKQEAIWREGLHPAARRAEDKAMRQARLEAEEKVLRACDF